uniref:DUF1795 domain-containing protein n=1 Tax=Schlesneria paludicola TaxID=360056 RepID=A0A7C2NWT4_9PLAN
MNVFCDDGVRFEYPDDWSLARETGAGRITLHLQTPGAAFWCLTLLTDCPSAAEAIEAAAAAYQAEYPQVDVYRDVAPLEGGPAAGCNLDFVYVDLVSSVSLRAEETNEFTALVLYQGEDRELEEYRPQFEAVTASLRYGGELAEG